MRRGCAPVCVTSGGSLASQAASTAGRCVPLPAGLQPRAAVGYLTTAIAAVLARAGLAPDMAEQVGRDGRACCASMAAELAPAVPEPYNFAKVLARRLLGRLAVVYGFGVTAPAARRWKTQLNENAKMPAAFGELPELDHNEIVGWEGDPELLSAAVRGRPGGSARRRARPPPPAADAGARSRARGRSGRGRRPRPVAAGPLLTAAYVGDWVSLYLALLAGVDPTPVAAIEQLKRTLAAGSPDGA